MGKEDGGKKFGHMSGNIFSVFQWVVSEAFPGQNSRGLLSMKGSLQCDAGGKQGSHPLPFALVSWIKAVWGMCTCRSTIVLHSCSRPSLLVPAGSSVSRVRFSESQMCLGESVNPREGSSIAPVALHWCGCAGPVLSALPGRSPSGLPALPLTRSPAKPISASIADTELEIMPAAALSCVLTCPMSASEPPSPEPCLSGKCSAPVQL